ncbi:MAG: NAD-dependent epimerase/dehydratase family protein [Aliidongia sp.]
MFRLLILGGTTFLGRHLVDAALERRHAVTLFNRGRTNPGLYPMAEHIAGDRDGGLGALAGRRWHAVIDTSGYVPRLVRQSAMALDAAAEHYCFVSTISTYAKPEQPGLDETAPIATIDDPLVETVTPETYGALKGACEAAVEATLPGRTLIVRPGLIVGPHDPSDRFGYWVTRLRRGGAMLAPGRAEAPMQLIDARDLSAWMIRMAESSATGIYNATGPAETLTMGALLDAGKQALGSTAKPVWVGDQFLLDQSEAVSLPFWIPATATAQAGLLAMDCRRALGAGLKFRPLSETFEDTAAWLETRPADHAWKTGLSPARETALLAAWRKSTAASKRV